MRTRQILEIRFVRHIGGIVPRYEFMHKKAYFKEISLK